MGVHGWVIASALARVLAPEIVPPPPEQSTPATYSLQWDAPPGCSSSEAIRARVEAMLSGPPAGVGEAQVVGVVTQQGRGVTLRLTTRFEGREDLREVEANSCAALEDATALLLAIALEPALAPPEEAQPLPNAAADDPPADDPSDDRTDSQEAPSDARTPPPVPSPPPELGDAAPPESPPQTPSPADAQPGTRRPPPKFAAGFGLGAEFGALGLITGALRGTVGVAWARLRLDVLGTYLTPRRRPSQGAGALSQLGTAGLRACWTPTRARWVFDACGGGEVGGLRVAPRGVEGPTRSLGFAGPGASASVGRELERIVPFVRAELVARTWGTAVTLAGQELVGQVPVSFRLVAGIRLKSP